MGLPWNGAYWDEAVLGWGCTGLGLYWVGLYWDGSILGLLGLSYTGASRWSPFSYLGAQTVHSPVPPSTAQHRPVPPSTAQHCPLQPSDPPSMSPAPRSTNQSGPARPSTAPASSTPSPRTPGSQFTPVPTGLQLGLEDAWGQVTLCHGGLWRALAGDAGMYPPGPMVTQAQRDAKDPPPGTPCSGHSHLQRPSGTPWGKVRDPQVALRDP